MKRTVIIASAILALVASVVLADRAGVVYRAAGGALLGVGNGAKIDVESGGELDINSGATLDINTPMQYAYSGLLAFTDAGPESVAVTGCDATWVGLANCRDSTANASAKAYDGGVAFTKSVAGVDTLNYLITNPN